mgnify:CR=1 FL=1
MLKPSKCLNQVKYSLIDEEIAIEEMLYVINCQCLTHNQCKELSRRPTDLSIWLNEKTY